MARNVRVKYPGAIYHVMNRGDHSGVAFRDRQGSVTAFSPCLPRSPSHLPHPVNPVHPVHSVVRLQIKRHRGYHILSFIIFKSWA
jgi:hypothetical protein